MLRERQLRGGGGALGTHVGCYAGPPARCGMAPHLRPGRELADRAGTIAAVRTAVAEARERMAARTSTPSTHASSTCPRCAPRRTPPSAPGPRAMPSAEEEALRSGQALAARMRQLAEGSGAGWQRTSPGGRGPGARGRGAGASGGPRQRGAVAAVRFRDEALGNLVGVAYARLREAEALLDSRGDAAEALRDAHSIASECGAIALREACEQLARRARIRLGDEEPPSAFARRRPLRPYRARARGARARSRRAAPTARSASSCS